MIDTSSSASNDEFILMAGIDQTRSRILAASAVTLVVVLLCFAAFLVLQSGHLAMRSTNTNPRLSPEFFGTWSIVRPNGNSMISSNGNSETFTFYPDGTANANDEYAYRWSVVDGVFRIVAWEQEPSSLVRYFVRNVTELKFVPEIDEGNEQMKLRGTNVTLVRPGIEER